MAGRDEYEAPNKSRTGDEKVDEGANDRAWHAHMHA